MSDIHIALPFTVSPQRLFDVCTDPVALTTWFAEHVDVSPAENRYNFWGKCTPGNPKKSDGQHKLLQLEPGRLLSYEWHLRGAATTVEYEFTPDGDDTLFKVHHRGLPELKPYESSIGDFWTHALEGLRAWLDRGTPPTLMDYANVPYGDVRLTVEIATNPHDVFVGLTDPGRLNQWIATDAQVDLRPGGRYTFGWSDGPIRIIDLVPDKKLSYAWNWPGETETITTWELEGSGGRTRLTVVQSGFDAKRNSEDYYVGWFKYIHRFKALLEGGESFQRIRNIPASGVAVADNEI